MFTLRQRVTTNDGTPDNVGGFFVSGAWLDAICCHPLPINDARNAAPVQRGCRQVGQRPSLIVKADVGVFHRHLDVGMTREFLSFRERRPHFAIAQ